MCDSKEKAEILLDQFQSVFTRDGGSAPPHLDPPQHPIISDININTAGVCNLLKAINPHKAYGPDQIPNVILKNCADTLAPALRDIFQRSLDTAVLPSDWRTANVSAVFQKFDTVPHSKLLTKVSHYGIGGTILEWLNKFLTGRTMKVVLDGKMSREIPVDSGVP